MGIIETAIESLRRKKVSENGENTEAPAAEDAVVDEGAAAAAQDPADVPEPQTDEIPAADVAVESDAKPDRATIQRNMRRNMRAKERRKRA